MLITSNPARQKRSRGPSVHEIQLTGSALKELRYHVYSDTGKHSFH